MIFLWTLISLVISQSMSPTFVLLSVIFLSILMGCFMLFFKFFFLFLIWGLVYVGGMMIIFTYIVFFSNYKELKNQKKSNPSVMVVGAMILSKKFSFYLPLLEMGESVKENFESFIFLGEENFHLPLMIFFIIASVLVMVLPMLKFSLNQFSQSLSS